MSPGDKTGQYQSRIKVFGGPRLDTILGPHTHPSLPSSFDPINLTGVWSIRVSPSKKFEIANVIGEFQRRNQVNSSEVKIEDKARTYGAKCLRIESKAQTEGEGLDREENRSGEGVRWSSP